MFGNERYTPKSSEEVSKETTEAHAELDEARAAVEGKLFKKFWSEQFGDINAAETKVENAQERYHMLENAIRDEAERYVEAYKWYQEALDDYAGQFGGRFVPHPRDINEFIDTTPRIAGKDGEDTHREIDRLVIEDLFMTRIPAGTEFVIPGTERKAKAAHSVILPLPADARMTFEEARTLAESQGKTHLLRIAAQTSVESRKKQPYGESSNTASYATDVATTWVPMPQGPHGLGYVYGRSFLDRSEHPRGEETYIEYINEHYETSPVSIADESKKVHPVRVAFASERGPFPIEEADAEEALERIWSVAGYESISFANLKALKEKKVVLADGTEVPLLELTKEMLEKSRQGQIEA